jgi:Uma2 family endonuclease
MSSALKPWTIETFLAWEERQELRFEFDGFQPVAMTGGTFEHDAIQVNIVTALATGCVTGGAAFTATVSKFTSWAVSVTPTHS